VRIKKAGAKPVHRSNVASEVRGSSKTSRNHYIDAWLPAAACSMMEATDSGCERKTEWLALTSTTFEPARFDMKRWASGGIIRSSVVTRYQLGFVFQAASVTVPLNASSPHGTCEAAMKAAVSGFTSPANAAGSFFAI